MTKLRIAVLTVLTIAILATPAGSAFGWTQRAEKQLVNQVQDEIEPALIAYTYFGVEYLSSVWMNFDPNINAASTLRYTSWTVGGGGSSTTGAIPTVAGYSTYADPVLVKHPQVNRIFLVALAQQGGSGSLNTAIVVWYSNDGASSWSSGQTLAVGAATVDGSGNVLTGAVLDKPVAATGPDGKLWVSYIRNTNVPNAGALNHLTVRYGTTSGSPLTWTWSSAITVTNQAAPMAPQIAVDSNNDVYVLATRSPGIGFWRDDAQTPGVSFAALPFIPGVGTLYRGTTILLSPGIRLRAVTVPIMKLDRVSRRISVVWHEGGAFDIPNQEWLDTRLQYAVWRLDTGGWSNATFAAGAGIHHVNVGLDYDSSGNVLVTWYRFSGTTYQSCGKYVTFDANHNPQWVSDNVVTNRLGNAANLTPDSTGMRYIGEYHEVSFTNGKFNSVHIIAVAPWSDPWAFTVSQP